MWKINTRLFLNPLFPPIPPVHNRPQDRTRTAFKDGFGGSEGSDSGAAFEGFGGVRCMRCRGGVFERVQHKQKSPGVLPGVSCRGGKLWVSLGLNLDHYIK